MGRIARIGPNMFHEAVMSTRGEHCQAVNKIKITGWADETSKQMVNGGRLHLHTVLRLDTAALKPVSAPRTTPMEPVRRPTRARPSPRLQMLDLTLACPCNLADRYVRSLC